MNNLISKVKELLTNGDIDVFIGYEDGTRIPRPFFIRSADEADRLIFNDQCTGNLAVYLTRKDLIGGKKVGIAASYYTLKSICQLYNENQIKEDSLKVFGLVDGTFRLFENIGEIHQYLKDVLPPEKPTNDKLIRLLDEMTAKERWEYWANELSKCFKCYACRAACPMCYCTKCIVEVNRPQWIQPWATTISNVEWQINRVMHMAGRCSGCGSCEDACPLGLPIYALNRKMAEVINENFGEQDGKSNVLSTFKPEDKETFIL